MDRACPHDGFDWAQRFDEDAKLRMLVNPTDVGRLDAHRDFRSAVPTPDHFLPLLYLAGRAWCGRVPGVGAGGRFEHLRQL